MTDEIRQCDLPDVTALAFLGDAIFSHAVRAMLVGRGISRSGELTRLSLAYVTAEAQSEGYLAIEKSLTEAELAVAHRAANSHRLNPPKHAPHADYRRATALEALLGMLEVTGQSERLNSLIGTLLSTLAPRENSIH